MREEIVITGSAAACCLGNTREEAWSGLLGGRSGVSDLTALESAPAIATGGAQCPPLALPDEHTPEALREARYLRHVCADALSEAGLRGGAGGRTVGMVIGSTLHGIRGAGRYFRTGNARHLAAVPAGDTLRWALRDLPVGGCRITVCSACSSGLVSIGLAATMLRLGLCDVVVAGGYDPVSEYAHAGFASLRLMASGPCLPFCEDREGLKVAEGYGVVILERAADAAARGARPLGRLCGFGDSSDAHHLTHPHPDGSGAAAAIERALASAGLGPGDVDMLVAHGTGTPTNDGAEQAPLSRLAAARAEALPVAAMKPSLGHTLGAAGAVELVMTLCALRDGAIPAAAGVRRDRLEYPGVDLVCESPRRGPLRRSLNVSLGFGGSNAAAVVEVGEGGGRAGNGIVRRDVPPREVAVTGVGVVTPAACGLESFLSERRNASRAEGQRRVDPDSYAHLINARRLRRIGECARLTVAACTQAMRHAGVADDAGWKERALAVSASAAGSVEYSSAYYREIVESGLGAANPMLFAEGVPNAPAAHMSMVLGIQGGSFSVIGSRCAGLDAVCLATARIRTGECDGAIVCAAEEANELIDAAVAGDRNAGSNISAAAALVLEEAEGAVARGVQPLGRLLGGSWGLNGSDSELRGSVRTGPNALSVDPLLDVIAALLGSGDGPAGESLISAVDCSGTSTALRVEALGPSGSGRSFVVQSRP